MSYLVELDSFKVKTLSLQVWFVLSVTPLELEIIWPYTYLILPIISLKGRALFVKEKVESLTKDKISEILNRIVI